MKKTIKSISVLLAAAAVCSGLTFGALAADKVEKVTAGASYATKTITIDGVKDDLYNQSDAIEVDHVADTKDPSLFNPDFKGVTYTLWDEEYFYIFTEVTDSDVVKNNGGSLAEAKKNDRITYYFDFKNTTDAAYGYSAAQGLYYGVHCTDDEDYKFTFNDDVSTFTTPDPGTADYNDFLSSTFKTEIKYTSTGYNAETRIRLTNLKYTDVFGNTSTAKVGNGVQFGFDVYLHDWQSGKTDDRVSLCTWSEASDNMSWNYPGYLGTLTLKDKPESAGKNGWVTENGKLRYYQKGTLIKNKFVIRGTDTVYVDANGYLVTNKIITTNGKKFYVNKTGKLLKSASGYAKITTAGKINYIVNKNGVIQTNKVVKIGTKRYIARKNGKLYKGNKVITFNKNKYYVNKNGVVATSTWKTYKKAKYRFKANGVALKKTLKKITGKYYYFNNSCKMVKNKTVKIGKKYYYFNAKGVGTRVK